MKPNKQNKPFIASRDSCVLSSYMYALNMNNVEDANSANVVFLAYIKYFRELHTDGVYVSKLIEYAKDDWNKTQYGDDFGKIVKSYTHKYKVSNYGDTVRELLSTIMLHYHCKKEANNLSGYKHLCEFNDRLLQDNAVSALGVKSNLQVIECYDGQGHAISDNSNVEKYIVGHANRCALILYFPVGNLMAHSVLVYIKGNTYYMIDPNKGVPEVFDFSTIQIIEYLIFEPI